MSSTICKISIRRLLYTVWEFYSNQHVLLYSISTNLQIQREYMHKKIHKESFSPIDMEGKVVEMAKEYTNSTPCILGECPRKTKENLLAVAYCGKPYICYPCGRIF